MSGMNVVECAPRQRRHPPAFAREPGDLHRRRRHTKEDAEDLVQAFFARFLAKNYLAGLSAERGRFRAFLLASLKNFLTNEWKKSQRLKRGGGDTVLSLAWATADPKFQVAATNEPSPDKAFDREWAVRVAAHRLRKRYRELLRDEITHTLADPAQVDEEMRALFGAFG